MSIAQNRQMLRICEALHREFQIRKSRIDTRSILLFLV